MHLCNRRRKNTFTSSRLCVPHFLISHKKSPIFVTWLTFACWNSSSTALHWISNSCRAKKNAKYAQKGDWHLGQVISVRTFSYGTGMNIIKDGPGKDHEWQGQRRYAGDIQGHVPYINNIVLYFRTFFTESAHWTDSVFKVQYPSVCLSVCLSVWCLCHFFQLKKALLLLFTNYKSPISQLQKDSLGNN